jgi:hypothetical protein
VVKQFEEREEIWTKEWWVSNKKPRLRAVEEGRIGVEERKRKGWILENRIGVPTSAR